MLKVLIVDDEPFIRQGLRIMIDWESYGFEVYKEAKNGKEAIGILEGNQIDLVFTDIRMPEMDGLELIKHVREYISDAIPFIILSGYYEFKYAKQAIQYKVVDYLLKPIQKEELTELLKKINKDYLYDKEKNEIAKEKERIIFHQHLLHLLHGKYNKEDLIYVKQHMGHSTNFRYVSFDFHGRNSYFGNLSLEEKIEYQNNVYEKLCSLLSKNNWHVIRDVDRNKKNFDVGVLITDPMYIASNKGENEYIRGLYESVKKSISDEIQVYIGSCINKLEHLSKSYQAAMQTKSYGDYYEKEEGVHFFENIPQVTSNQFHLSSKLISRFIKGVEKNIKKEIHDSIDEIYYEFECKLVYPHLIKNNLYFLMYQMANLLKSANSSIDREEEYKYISQDKFEAIAENGNKDEFVTFTLDFAQYLDNIQNSSSKHILPKIQKDIETSYMEKLSLKDFGEKYYINSVYLGQVFRKEYGVSFKDYLNNYRIEKACELLETTDDRVYKIATAVGFQNPDYFINKFLQLKEVTPGKYRMKAKMRKNLEKFTK